MKQNSPKNRIRNCARKTMVGLALTTPLLISGCASLQKSGYGVVKSIDGVARFATGASVGEKLGIYSPDPNVPNYKAPETYTGNGIGDRIKYTLISPVNAVRQVGEGIGDIVGGFYDAFINPIVNFTQGTKLETVADCFYEATNPDDLNGVMVPTLKYGLNRLEEVVGNVHTDSADRIKLEERMNTTQGKFVGALPIVHHAGDIDNAPLWKKVLRMPKEALYFVFSFGSSSGSGSGSGSGTGGSWGAGGAGAN